MFHKRISKGFTLNHQNSGSGFTLIELLVVCGIIAILATVVFINYSQAQAKSRDSKRKSDLETIAQAINFYKNDTSMYPLSTDVKKHGLVGDIATKIAPYLTVVPHDPRWPYAFPDYYYMTGWTDSAEKFAKFRLYSVLENVEDPQYKPCTICTIGCHEYYYSIPDQDYGLGDSCFSL